MKYTSQQINCLSWQEWNELMAKELNNAGFKSRWGDYDADDEPSLFIHGMGEKEVAYLKELGLLNNGRCPQCGNVITGNPGRFTSGYNPNLHFQICQNCVSRGKRTSVNPANNAGGCMVALLMIPWHLIKNIFIG